MLEVLHLAAYTSANPCLSWPTKKQPPKRHICPSRQSLPVPVSHSAPPAAPIDWQSTCRSQHTRYSEGLRLQTHSNSDNIDVQTTCRRDRKGWERWDMDGTAAHSRWIARSSSSIFFLRYPSMICKRSTRGQPSFAVTRHGTTEREREREREREPPFCSCKGVLMALQIKSSAVPYLSDLSAAFGKAPQFSWMSLCFEPVTRQEVGVGVAQSDAGTSHQIHLCEPWRSCVWVVFAHRLTSRAHCVLLPQRSHLPSSQ